HQLTLELTVALTAKGNDRGIELDLPRAPITNLELTLPNNVKEVRVGTKAVADSLLTLNGAKLAGPIGPVEKLDVRWLKPGATANTPAVLTASARIFVQLDEKESTTRAELTLRSEGLPTNQFRLLVPKGATVRLSPEDQPRLQNIASNDQANATQRTIRL